MQLHEYQKRAIEFALAKKSTYMMIDMGLGKTAIALKTIERQTKPALIFAPLRACYTTWIDEIKKWTPKLTYVILHGRDKDLNLRLRKHLYIINYEGLKWFYNSCATGKFKLLKFFLVLDEASMIKDPSTKRFKMFQRMKPIMSDYRMCLSATPAPNGLHELWSQFYILDRGQRLLPRYYSFRNQYFSYSGPPIYQTRLLPGANKKIYAKVADITFRLDHKDYLKMPDIIYNKVLITLPHSLKKSYDELEKNFTLDFSQTRATAFNAAALSNKLRQFLQGAVYTDEGCGTYHTLHDIKVRALKELLESSAGQPILVPIQYRFEVEIIQKGLKMDIPAIHGNTSTRMSINYIRQWNEGSIPILLCHPLSMGHGVNLQAGGHIIVWYGLTWSLEQYQQLNGRIYRQGQRKGVVVNHLLFRDTIDTTVYRVLTKKDATQAELLAVLKQVGGQA